MSWIKVVSRLDTMETVQSPANHPLSNQENRIIIFLGGDVMTGRGIDQILPHPSEPFIPEFRVNDAREYVTRAIKLRTEGFIEKAKKHLTD
ncbi:MAG: hypothetical protein QNJ41_23650 [Xenococcaceae cyanobacterium MO_188.B32]|nr:hypothetical protein [Xenococcaceae cyanobacterium MO_188.B32]